MADMVRNKRSDVTPAEDYGFFGPGSVAWKVWGYATSLTIGFSRAVVVEELDPNLVASVDRTQDIYQSARGPATTGRSATSRSWRSATAAPPHRAADVLVKVHSKAIGTEPYGGGRYDANDPDSQLWILVTGWHSVLKAYETYGPGRLTEAEEAQFWAECAVAAELQTLLADPADVPRYAGRAARVLRADAAGDVRLADRAAGDEAPDGRRPARAGLPAGCCGRGSGSSGGSSGRA